MNDGIKYDVNKVTEGLKAVSDDISSLEKAKDLLIKGFEKIKKAKGYSEIANKLMIKDETVTKMLDNCTLEFNSLANNTSSLVNSIERFDTVEQANSNKFNNSKDSKPITQDQVKEAIKNNISRNQDLVNMFNNELYTKINEELSNLALDDKGTV
ncbi:MAG: hypothetical protein IJI58_01825 [Bacilli bacterium]|nr:hypothetical protein [Bacilli bacterium]